MIKIQVFVCAILLPFMLGGCSAAKIKSTWKDPGFSEKSKSVLIVGVAAKDARRRIFEAAFAEKLRAQGVQAVASYTVFSEEELNEQAVTDYARQKSIKSIIVVKVLDAKEFSQRVSYGNAPNPYYQGFNGWHADYHYWSTSISTYENRLSIVNLEADLFPVDGKNMAWSALVEVQRVDNDDSGIDALVKALVKQMHRDGLF